MMAQIRFYLNDGSSVDLFDLDDFENFIGERLGSDFQKMIAELRSKADEVVQGVQHDLQLYEEKLENANLKFDELKELVIDMDIELTSVSTRLESELYETVSKMKNILKDI